MTTATTTAKGCHLFNIRLNSVFSLKANVLTSCTKMKRKEVVFAVGYEMNRKKSNRRVGLTTYFKKRKRVWSKYII